MPVIDLGRVIGPQGPQGVQGAQGQRGEQGFPGPNIVGGETPTTLTGVLVGNGNVVGTRTIDAEPTADSTGFATSGGTKTALDTKANQEQLAPIEWGTTASGRHRVGEYFCFGGLLYKCTVEIPANGPITPGTNCTPSYDGGINNVSIGLDISSSITPSTGVVISKALLIGRMVYISGSIPKITSASTTATYANMSKYKPWGSTAIGNLVFASSGDFGYGQIYVTTAGAIQAIYSKTTTYGLYFTICYYTDDV